MGKGSLDRLPFTSGERGSIAARFDSMEREEVDGR
jgi:hypothetical protein